MTTLRLSTLPKTWVFDVDGTLVIHNGHLRPQGDELLPGVKEFFASLPAQDAVVLLTARKKELGPALEAFLTANGIRYDAILYGMPAGERILVNDCKPSGLLTAVAVNKKRNDALFIHTVLDESL
ncbi:hypothetical protein [Sutterella wadsworthensis]|jgi:hypothetical protein|uniref:hypothetical protein n=1 Tax=Sutterella wadsworthensis TaxID=40545 RepID=UPI0013F64C21|nr:hypothetical protein [Sutterella wadsworthensis]MCB7457117.1 hypothetical protein [Sutterella wadsworthensis]